MISLTKLQDIKRLRRIALAAQGLVKDKPFGNGVNAVRRAIQHLGYIQIDTISVIERAHHHVLFSRVPNYQPTMLDKLLSQRHVFEYWSHAAAYLPVEDYRFSLPYKQAIKDGQVHWFKNKDEQLMAELLERIRIDGPLRARDIETEAKSKKSEWWDWKPAKKALEQLFMQGDLMVSSREGFQKVYDLTERVLPSDINTALPSDAEFAKHLLDQQLRCHGLVSLKGITYLRRNSGLKQAVKALVDAQVDAGVLTQVQLHNEAMFYLPAGALDEKMPRLNQQLRIVSPFDNAVIQRDRLLSVFDFDYQIECYVPEAKRKFGYFSLPLLYQGAFVGRMDCKAHRKERCLEIKSLHFEVHHFDQDAINTAFLEAIKKFMAFHSCDSVTLTEVQPKALFQTLRRALGDLN